jgi:hypothetical protein
MAVDITTLPAVLLGAMTDAYTAKLAADASAQAKIQTATVLVQAQTADTNAAQAVSLATADLAAKRTALELLRINTFRQVRRLRQRLRWFRRLLQ